MVYWILQLASSFLFFAACLAPAAGFGAMAIGYRIGTPLEGKEGKLRTQPTEQDYRTMHDTNST